MFYVFADGVSMFDPLDSTQSILSPKVTLELGKSGSFQFSIPKTNLYYNTLEQLKTNVVVYLDNTEIFRGRVLSISRGFNNIKTVYCEGILSYLVDSVQKARRFNGKAKTLYEDILKRHNAMVEEYKRFSIDLGSYGVENATVVIPGKKEDGDAYYGENKYAQAIIESIVNEWQTSYDYINKIFIDYLGGYLIAKYDERSGKNYIDYISNDALDKKLEDAQNRNTADHEIEFGVNMLDFSEEGNAEDMFTVLIPLGDGDEDVLTIANATNKYDSPGIELVSVNGKTIGIADREMREKYGSIVKTHSFSNVNKANTLFTDAVRYLKMHKNMPVTYTIKAVDLHFINKTNAQIEIGDSVKITSPVHGIDRYLLCTKIEYDLSNPANTSYTFGNPEQSLTERYKKDKDKTKNSSEQSSTSAAKGSGGAAGAAKADAVDEAQGIVNELYDAYIKVDAAAGKITMATLYKDIVEGKANLFAMSGINLDAGPEAAKVNIYTMFEGLNQAKTSIEQLSDALHAEIEIRSKYDTDLTSALNSYKQEANGKFATQEMLTQFDTKTSKALAGLRTYANDTFATIETFTSYKNEVSSSFTSIKQWASSTFAAISITSEFDTKLANTKAAIEQWATGKFAGINIMSEYKTAGGRTVAQIEQYVDDTSSKLALTSKTVTSQGTTIGELTFLTNKLESVFKAATNYDSLKWDPTGKKLTGTVTSAKTFLTSDALKSAIDNTTNFGTYIDGKLLHSTTSIKQTADASKAEVELIANFSGSGAKLKLESVKDALTDAIKSKIVLEAANISLEAQKTISLLGEKTIISNLLDAKTVTLSGTLFANEISSKGSISAEGTISCQKTLSCPTLNASGKITANGGISVVKGQSLKVGGTDVALKTDIPDVSVYFKTSDFTATKIKSTLAKQIDWASYLRSSMKGDYKTFDAYIKSIIDAAYIKSIIDGTYIKDTLGCKDGLSDYISKHSAKKHTHTVTIGHTHKYADKNGNYVNTQGASKADFTTSSNS